MNAKQQERRAQALDVLNAGLDHVIRDPLALAAHLRFRGRFHTYSVRNALLLAEQARRRNTTARFFKGYKGWQEVGRQVRKGEKGYALFAPVTRTLKGQEAEDAGVPHGTRRLVGFRVTTVFAMAQTETQPGPEQDALCYVGSLPTLDDPAGAKVYQALLRVAEEIGFRVLVYPPHLRQADGYCRYRARVVGIKRSTPAHQAATLAHELAHALAHRGTAARQLSHATREIQAEGAAFLTCSVLGLDTGRVALPYLQGYVQGETAGDRRADLLQHLERIDRVGLRLVQLTQAARQGMLPTVLRHAAA